jgi:hypothetical protein
MLYFEVSAGKAFSINCNATSCEFDSALDSGIVVKNVATNNKIKLQFNVPIFNALPPLRQS